MQMSSPHTANQSLVLGISHAVLVDKMGILNDQRNAQHTLKNATAVHLLWSKLYNLYCVDHFTPQMIFNINFYL